MRESELIAQLQREGFAHTYVWEDTPNAHYPDHTHGKETAHIILNGEMIVRMNGTSTTFRNGDRCDVPANAIHSAIIGPKGCRYLIGER